MKELKLKILSSRDEHYTTGISTCYLSEGTLEDYVISIPDRYTEYDIQRGLVKNIYLDKLTETILNNKFIPPIVLISEEQEIQDDELIIQKYKILDGLQRTYRIKSIYNALQLFIDEYDNIDKDISKYKLSKQFKDKLDKIGYDANILWTILIVSNERKYSLNYLKNIFKSSLQWFEVWTSLEKKEQINKMLVLNAGHKPMDIKHQLELLFLNIIPEDKLKMFTRAKDVNSSFFYKNKTEGQLHLSHFISAMLAFDNAKPITVDADFLHKLQENLDLELERFKLYFENNNLVKFVNLMENLDIEFNKQYNSIGLEWLGRETILIGIFSAFGSFYKNNSDKGFDWCLNEILNTIKKNIKIFNINEFNQCKTKSIDITKVNIGNIFKYTTFNAMYLLLEKNVTNINWDELFKHGTKAYYES